MRGFIGFWVILLLIGASLYYWRISWPILAVFVIIAVIGGRGARAKAREEELARQARVRNALEAAHQWALDQSEVDAKKKVIAELQAQVDQARLRNEISRLDHEWLGSTSGNHEQNEEQHSGLEAGRAGPRYRREPGLSEGGRHGPGHLLVPGQ